MFKKERKERCRKGEKKQSKNENKNIKKHAQEQNKAKKPRKLTETHTCTCRGAS